MESRRLHHLGSAPTAGGFRVGKRHSRGLVVGFGRRFRPPPHRSLFTIHKFPPSKGWRRHVFVTTYFRAPTSLWTSVLAKNLGAPISDYLVLPIANGYFYLYVRVYLPLIGDAASW